MTDCMLETRKLSKTFKGHPAVRNVSLRVPRGRDQAL